MTVQLPKFWAGVICSALCAIASSAALHGQSTRTIYWNTDSDDGSISIEGGALSADQAGNVSTFYDSIDDVPDFFFSSDKVGTEAQTVALDSPSGYQFNTLSFLKGSIGLTGATAIVINNGLTLGTDAGPTSIALQGSDPIAPGINTGSIYFEDSTWNNNSASDLTINANVAPYLSTQTLTFDGTGTGAIRFNGSFNGRINQESATSIVYVGNRSGIDSLNLSNGGQVWFTTSEGYVTPTVATTAAGGEIDFNGDTVLANNGSNVTFNATSLTFGAGDALDASSTAQNITTLNLDGSHVDGSNNPIFSRLIVGFTNNAGLNLLANTQTINVSNNYILDFGFGNNGGAGYTFNGTVNFASGSALEARNNSYVILSDAVLPTSGTFTIGDDDAGGGFFDLHGTSNLTGPLTITEKGTHSGANFIGNITGTGSLTFTGTGDQLNGVSFLSGTNSFNGLILAPTSGDNATPRVQITGDSSGIGSIQVQRGLLELVTGAKVPTNSPIVLGSATDGGFSILRIGNDSGSANVTVYGVTSIRNDHTHDTIVSTGSAGSQLTWDIESGTNEYDGLIGAGPFIYDDPNANKLELIKTGAGTLVLGRSDNVYIGGTIINGGTLSVFGGGNYGAGQAATGTGTITINNASTLNVMNGQSFIPQIVLGTKGTLTVNGGDTYQVAGQLSAFNASGNGIDSVMADPNAATGNGQAGIVGGNGIAIVGGDVLVQETEVTTPGEIDIVGGRLLMFNNDDFIDGATKIVTAGGTLDFGAGGNQTVVPPVYFGANGAIETRGTNTVINNLAPVVGTSGAMPSLTIGTDDGGGGSITVANSVNITNSTGGIKVIGVQADNRGFTTANFAGGFSGTGNLTFDTAGFVNDYITNNNGYVFVSGTSTYQGDTTIQGGILDLTGNNTGVTSAGGGAPNYYIVATAKSYVDDSSNTRTIGTPGILQIGAGGSLASNANVVVGGSNGFAYLVLGDNTGAGNASVGHISVSGSGNDNGAILGGSSSLSTLTVNVNGGTDVYAGIFGDSHGYDFNNTREGSINNHENNLAVVFNIGAGGVMDLQGFNPGNVVLAGGFTANGGTLKVDGNAGALGASNVTLNNVDLQIGNNQYGSSNTNPHVILGTGTNRIDAEDGIDNFSGDIQSGAGSVVNISGSNFIFTSDNVASTIGTLNIDGGRIFLMNSTGLNIIAGNTTVNVSNNAFFDIASGTTATLDNQINFTSGTGLVQRNSNTNITLTNANLPTAGSFTIGSDDVGGDSNVSFKITSGLVLTGDLALHVVSNSNVPVTLAGNISGNGGISEDSGGNLFLTGTNTYSGTTSAVFANLFIDGDNSGAGVNYFSNFSTITIGHGGQVASNAHLQFGNGGGPGTFVLGDSNGAVSQTIASLDVLGAGGTYTVYNGNTHDSTNSVLTVNNPSNDTFVGTLGNSSATNGNNMALVKNGVGTLTLSGANTYTGGTTVTGGKLAVDGSIAGNAVVNSGAEIGGHGSIGGTLSGAGVVGPGNSPGILTAAAVDPSGGTSFNFEFTLAIPDFSNAASSGNDILHLEGGTPFLAALTSANAINLYFTGGGTFEGGFFTNGVIDNLTLNVADATYNYYVLDAAGAYTYNGNHYDLTTGLESTLPALGANFGDGTVDGFTQEFIVEGAPAIPEPSTYALIGMALLVLVVFIRRRHAI